MAIDLSDLEAGKPFDGDYHEALAKVQKRLAHAQIGHIVHRRSAVLVFEGWDAAGKGGIIRRLTAKLDPHYVSVWPTSAPTKEEADHHFLWRFWPHLPAKRHTAVFDRSWYGRVLVERVENLVSTAELKRAYDEINAFERQLVTDGTTLIKLFLHVTQKEQDARLAKRLDHPWKRWKTGREDFRNRSKRADYLDAIDDMFKRTDSDDAPWKAFDANDKKAARIAALNYIADRLEAQVKMEPPPPDPAVVELARQAFGYEPKTG